MGIAEQIGVRPFTGGFAPQAKPVGGATIPFEIAQRVKTLEGEVKTLRETVTELVTAVTALRNAGRSDVTRNGSTPAPEVRASSAERQRRYRERKKNAR